MEVSEYSDCLYFVLLIPAAYKAIPVTGHGGLYVCFL
jgi:hypothetical protein